MFHTTLCPKRHVVSIDCWNRKSQFKQLHVTVSLSEIPVVLTYCCFQPFNIYCTKRLLSIIVFKVLVWQELNQMQRIQFWETTHPLPVKGPVHPPLSCALWQTGRVNHLVQKLFVVCAICEMVKWLAVDNAACLIFSLGDAMTPCRPTELASWPRPQQSCPIKKRRCWATSWTGAWTLPVPVTRETRRKRARGRKRVTVSVGERDWVYFIPVCFSLKSI